MLQLKLKTKQTTCLNTCCQPYTIYCFSFLTVNGLCAQTAGTVCTFIYSPYDGDVIASASWPRVFTRPSQCC